MAITAKPLDQVRASVPLAAAAQDEIVRVGVNISQALRDHWKTEAIRNRTSVAAMIEQAMNEKYPKG